MGTCSRSSVGEGGIEIAKYKTCIALYEEVEFSLPLVSSSITPFEQKSVLSFDWNINKILKFKVFCG